MSAYEQLDLDAAGTLTGRDHPETSYAAAAAALGKTGSKRRLVLNAIAAYSSTDEQIMERLRLSPNTARPRRVELVRLGLIEDSGRRALTGAGHEAIVWQITGRGLRALAEAPS